MIISNEQLEIECKAVSGARFAPGAAFLCSNSICLQRPPCISTFLPGAMRASRPTHELWGYRKFYLYNMARGSGGVSDPALQKFRTLSTYSNPNIPARHHAPHSPNMIFSSFPKTGHAATPAACPALSQIPNYSFLISKATPHNSRLAA